MLSVTGVGVGIGGGVVCRQVCGSGGEPEGGPPAIWTAPRDAPVRTASGIRT
jgi:hypothetical protein